MSKSKRQIRRREFLKVAAAAATLPAARYAKILGANDRVRVGIVGFSDRFRQAHLPAYGQLGKELNFEIVAVSDIWSRRRDEGVTGIEKVMGTKPRAFRNNEEMYAAHATDAVVISTADFQHAYHGVEAMQAGQDAYIEKPLAHRIEDASAIRDAVKKSDRVVQIGTQRRSAANYQMASEYIRSGKFGDIVMAEMTWNVNQPGRWRRPQLVAAIKEQDTDWTRFLCNLPHEPWDPRIGLCIDVGHTVRTGTDVVRAVADAGPRLLDMHMKDLRDLTAKGSQCIVGEGAIPIADIFRQLGAMGYRGYVNLEYEIDPDAPLPGMKQSFAYMRGALAGLAAGGRRPHS